MSHTSKDEQKKKKHILYVNLSNKNTKKRMFQVTSDFGLFETSIISTAYCL